MPFLVTAASSGGNELRPVHQALRPWTLAALAKNQAAGRLTSQTRSTTRSGEMRMSDTIAASIATPMASAKRT